MLRIIVSDIFGKTEALEMLASEIPGDVEILDPYNGEVMGFDSEHDAYSYFTSKVGLEAYTAKLSDRIKASESNVSLIGFSVGASAIWRLSKEPALRKIPNAVLFYSSQIRHDTEIEPVFPICLIFPASESHFSVKTLIQTLQQKTRVEIHHSSYLHGFMNLHSKNYNAAAYKKYKQALCHLTSPCGAPQLRVSC